MSKKEQRRILLEMLRNMREVMLSKASRVPAEWTGLELRELFADQAQNFRYGRFRDDKKRFREYQRICLLRNLT